MMACRRVITEEKCSILLALYFQMLRNAVTRTQACCIDICFFAALTNPSMLIAQHLASEIYRRYFLTA